MRLVQISTIALVLAAPAIASAQIRSPGQHAHYAAELEPHVVLAWNNPVPCSDTGFGVGFHAAIPFLDNGPVPTINNNMAIGFGIDYAHYGGDYCGFGPGPFFAGFPDWTANAWIFPVVAQWNFFLTPKISVFGEPGLYINHYSYSAIYGCGALGPNGLCEHTLSHTGVDFTVSGGARFLITDSLSAMVRVGWPYLTAGVGIWL